MSSAQDDCVQTEKSYKSLIHYFLDDNDFIASGCILPYPGQKKNDKKPIMIHVSVKINNRPEIRNFIENYTHKKVKFLSCDVSEILKQITANGQTDTSKLVYQLPDRHVSGTLTIQGIYYFKSGSEKKVFFDIIRRASLFSKSQFNDIIEFKYIKGRWDYARLFNYEKS